MKTKKDKLWFAFEWIGTIFSIVAAVSMALFGQSHPDEQIYVFYMYFIGSLIWMIVGFKFKKNSIVTMNLVFLVINSIGIINRI